MDLKLLGQNLRTKISTIIAVDAVVYLVIAVVSYVRNVR